MPRGSTGTTGSTGGGGGSVTQGTVPWIIEGDVNLAEVGGVSIALGQTTMAASIPVTIASNQSAVTVSATNLDIRDLTSASDSILIYGSDDGGTTKRVIKTDSGGAVQVDVESIGTVTITGTVTANAGTNLNTSALALESGGNLATLAGTVTSSTIAIRPFAGTPTLGDDVTNTPSVLQSSAGNSMYQPVFNYAFDGSTWDRMRGDSTDGVLVNLGSNNDVTVTGSVTANAGTDLNTSALLTTSAFNAAFGTAGTADTQVMSIQGIASMTPVQIGDNSSSITIDGTVTVDSITNALPAGTNAIGKLAANSGVDIGDVDVTSIIPGTGATNLGKAVDGIAGATDTGVAVLAKRVDSPGTITPANGDYSVLQLDANGFLRTLDNNSGSMNSSLALLDDVIFTDDTTFTPGTSKVSMIGFQADEASTDSVDEGDAGAARMTLDRKQIVTVQPHTAGGLSTMNATSSDGATALTNSAQVIKASAGQVYGWYIYNPNSSAQFVQFYNTAAASVTVGTTNPLFMLTIPATSAANVNFVQGVTFTNAGFSWAATSTAGGNGAPSTALDAVCYYN